jgi:hypothetical protein
MRAFLLRFFLPILLLAQAPILMAQQKQKQQAQQKPPTSQTKPKPKQQVAPAKLTPQESFAELLVTTDLDAEISVNAGKPYPVYKKNALTRVPVEGGYNLLQITPLDGGADGYTREITAEHKGMNLPLKITLQARRDSVEQVRQYSCAQVEKIAQEIRELEANGQNILYCSNCMRSKSEIDRQADENFEQHLRNTKGEAIPRNNPFYQSDLNALKVRLAEAKKNCR